jgi:PPK2 family polyphosphate:nucleotide phosphotransferase
MNSGVNTLFIPVYTVPFSLIPLPIGTITRKCIYDEPIIFRNYGAPMKNSSFNLHDDLRVEPGRHIDLLKDYDPGYTGNFVKNEKTGEALEQGIRFLAEQQDMLYAQNTYGLLIILQALDAAGKDSTIKHVMSGVNPQGVEVTGFKEPSAEELDHDYLWRNTRALPRRGNIGIFNRSYYEEVLVVRVHPELLAREQIPPHLKDKNIWDRRYNEINCFENYLVNNGIIVIKLFLHVSKDVQKKRFLERVNEPEKHWKFSAKDIREMKYRDAYMAAYQDMLNATSTPHAPWYVIPADHKWFTHLAVTSVISDTLERLRLSYPTVGSDEMKALLAAKEEMEQERWSGSTDNKKGKG